MRPSRREFLEKSIAVGSCAALAQNVTAAANAPDPLSDTPRELTRGGADMGTLYESIMKLAERCEFDLSFVGERFRALDEFHREGRAAIFDALHYRPEAVSPDAEVIDRVDMGGYIREKILFNTTPQFRVPAYVLIPKGLNKPAPAIVDLHSHGGMFLLGKEKIVDLGLDHPVVKKYHQNNYEGRPTATEFVKRGYVVIAIDAFMFGERRLMLDADLHLGWDRWRYSEEDFIRLSRVCASKESTLAKSMCLAGASWPGIVFWDDMRTVDYLVTRPEVDVKRIGCCGVSMGGYRTIYLAALDERIRAASIVGFMSSVRPMLKAHIDTHSWVHFLAGLHQHLDLTDVASLTAPRALMVQQCSRDGLFPLEGMQASVQQIRAAYTKAGCEEQFLGKFYDRPHMFSIDMQEDTIAWFDRHL